MANPPREAARHVRRRLANRRRRSQPSSFPRSFLNNLLPKLGSPQKGIKERSRLGCRRRFFPSHRRFTYLFSIGAAASLGLILEIGVHVAVGSARRRDVALHEGGVLL